MTGHVKAMNTHLDSVQHELSGVPDMTRRRSDITSTFGDMRADAANMQSSVGRMSYNTRRVSRPFSLMNGFVL